MKTLQDMYYDFPDIIIEAIKFFELGNMKKTATGVAAQTVFDFVSHYAKLYKTSTLPPPDKVNLLLQRLSEAGFMSFSGVSSHGPQVMYGSNTYMCTLTQNAPLVELARLLNCVAFGLPIVFDNYKGSLLPIEKYSIEGEPEIGTAFVISENQLLTARHCVENASKLATWLPKDIPADKYEVRVSASEALDLAMITFAEKVFKDVAPVRFQSGDILQQVIVLGFPRIPGFAAHLAAEKATVSARLQVTTGAVASNPFEIFSKSNLYLISAKVKGGFSGGPVLSDRGICVGMISRTPDAYPGSPIDDLGYGVAIPGDTIVRFVTGTAQNEFETIKLKPKFAVLPK